MSTAERAEMAEQQSTANEKFETRPEPPLPPPLGKQEEQKPEVKEEKGADKEMKPWEQHSSVISIPRFDYNAPSALLQHSHSGFLITCPISQSSIRIYICFCILLFCFLFNLLGSNFDAHLRKRTEMDVFR